MDLKDISESILNRLNEDKTLNVRQLSIGRADVIYGKDHELYWIVRNQTELSSIYARDINNNIVRTLPGRPETSPEEGINRVISKNSKLWDTLLKGLKSSTKYIEPDGKEADLIVNSISRFEPLLFPEINAINGEIEITDDKLVFKSLREELKKLKDYYELISKTKEIGISEFQKDELLKQIKKIENDLLLLREGKKRHIRDSSALRDQPHLDSIQEEIKRSKILDGKIIITGGPGTGKTTSLIHRINFLISKTIEDYKKDLTEVDKSILYDKSRSWIFFSPSELLRHFLKNVMVNEDLNADDERVVVWEHYRRKLFNYFGLINAETQRPFQATQNNSRFFQINSGDLLKIVNLFEDFFVTKQKEKINKILSVFGESKINTESTSKLIDVLKTFDQYHSINDYINFYEILRKQFLNSIKNNIDNSDTLLDRIVAETQIMIEKNESLRLEFENLIRESRKVVEDEPEELSEEEVEENFDLTDGIDFKIEIFKLLKKTIRKTLLLPIDKQTKLSKTEKIISDKIKIYLNIDGHIELGKDVFIKKYFLKTLRGFETNILNEFASIYKMFRKVKMIDLNVFTVEGREIIEKNIKDGNKKVHKEEMDLILLLIFKLIDNLFRDNVKLFNESKHIYLVEYKNNSKVVIAIDEATDFSILELSCMSYLSYPKFKSVTLCGDVMQRLEVKGIDNWEEYRNIFEDAEIGNLKISYRQTSNLIEIAKKIYFKNTGEQLNIEPVYPKDELDPKPLIYKSKVLEDKINWLSERIYEIRSTYGNKLPSIAIFLSDDSKLQEYETELNKREILSDNDIRVKACMNGEVLGDAQNVRLFNIKYIKGLEFEAVFYVDLDTIVKGNDDMLDRYIYVGISRASFYLAITVNEELPDRLNYISEFFEEGTW